MVPKYTAHHVGIFMRGAPVSALCADLSQLFSNDQSKQHFTKSDATQTYSSRLTSIEEEKEGDKK